MNVKSIFGTIGEALSGITGVLGALVSVGILSQIVFGTSWLGMDVVTNIGTFVSSFLNGGVTGMLVLIVLLSLLDNSNFLSKSFLKSLNNLELLNRNLFCCW